jgi:DNA-binding MarR family transcriptional regulator
MSNLPFGFDKPEESLGFLLWQTTMLWQRQIKQALDRYQVSHAQFVILATLVWFEAHDYDTTQISIVNWTKLDKMTVSKSLKKLVEMDFVKRVEHKQDTRAKSVYLTKKGKALVTKLIPIIEEIDHKFFNQAPKEQQTRLKQILSGLAN